MQQLPPGVIIQQTLGGVFMFGIGIERVMLTELAAETFSDANIHIALFRHSNLDWGDVSEEDKKANDTALKDGSRVISFYGDMAVFTDFNECNVTTICLVSEIE